jgi:hypothetical protein
LNSFCAEDSSSVEEPPIIQPERETFQVEEENTEEVQEVRLSNEKKQIEEQKDAKQVAVEEIQTLQKNLRKHYVKNSSAWKELEPSLHSNISSLELDFYVSQSIPSSSVIQSLKTLQDLRCLRLKSAFRFPEEYILQLSSLSKLIVLELNNCKYLSNTGLSFLVSHLPNLVSVALLDVADV